MKPFAQQFTRGARIDGVTVSPASSLGVLSTRRGALLVDEGEWVVRVAGSEPFVLTDAEYRTAFAERKREPRAKSEPVALEPRAPRVTALAPRASQSVPPSQPGEIARPRSTLASHIAAQAYDGTDG